MPCHQYKQGQLSFGEKQMLENISVCTEDGFPSTSIPFGYDNERKEGERAAEFCL